MTDRIAFKDGFLDVYTRSERGSAGSFKGKYRFGKRVIGTRRFYAARSANVRVSELVAVPSGAKIGTDDIVIINKSYYDIKQLQEIPADGKGNPAHLLLTLEKGRDIV